VQDRRAREHGFIGPNSPHDVHQVSHSENRRKEILHVLQNSLKKCIGILVMNYSHLASGCSENKMNSTRKMIYDSDINTEVIL
jgi:hypothetical protein